MSKKTVSLVLSSGGARGMAHIGVIEALEESGYEIASIAGCSAGALIGGMHASGNLPKFKDWICNLDRIDVFSLMDFTLSSKGFIKGDKVFAALKKIIEDRLIEELDIPFVCTAVEIPTGKEHVFRKGSMYAAIRASASIPTAFTPAKIHGKEFIDGSILNPIPLNLIPKEKIADLVFAVDLNGPKTAFVENLKEKEKKESENSKVKLPNWLTEYRQKFSTYFSSNEKEEKIKGMSSLDLLNYSFDLLQDKLSELVLERHQVDIIVEISRTQAGTLEFHRAAELIEIGRQKAFAAIEKYENGH
ncbi:patatin-like phospholipase family protein [Aquiflexum gelatinilyticum]|uniref:patatin-like phospholipase family protein n=1 Tax=Aquiflexum gelatinilyticum TaxID=2961943 RepID=UPI0021690E0C|nr:patatin-like phospholipase family protein [Aquiflexum gelatinilyticum]MCS4433787.1 patatin-like phospholipase family protein [Aquiflexum gelatinilyticum]